MQGIWEVEWGSNGRASFFNRILDYDDHHLATEAVMDKPDELLS
jgi:hypothetical protein